VKRYFNLSIILVALVIVLVAAPAKPQGQELTWSMENGVCVFGETQGVPCARRDVAPVGDNWTGAAHGA